MAARAAAVMLSTEPIVDAAGAQGWPETERTTENDVCREIHGS